MKKPITTFGYIVCSLLLNQACRQPVLTYKLTDEYIRRCFLTNKICEPIILERQYKDQTVRIIANNQFEESALNGIDESFRKEILNGKPTMSVYLMDTTTTQQYLQGKIKVSSLKPIRADSAAMKHNISLDITGIPDGEYSLLISFVPSEWDDSFRLIIKTE